MVAPSGGKPAVHYHAEPRRRVKGDQGDMLWSFVENLVLTEMPAASVRVVTVVSTLPGVSGWLRLVTWTRTTLPVIN